MPKTKRETFDQRLGRRLSFARRAQKMTQTELSKYLGVSYQQIQKYEYGTNSISAGHLDILARALKVSPGWFFEKTAPKATITIS